MTIMGTQYNYQYLRSRRFINHHVLNNYALVSIYTMVLLLHRFCSSPSVCYLL